jgi:putative membrane protein
MLHAYVWLKSFHLLFVVAWLAAVFYLPRILVNLAESSSSGSAGQADVQARLHLMGTRLYKFGHHMFGLAFLLGMALWQGHRVTAALPDIVGPMKWIHAKLGLVALLLAFFIWSGRALKRHAAGGTLPSATALRWINELPIVLVLAAFYFVIGKPF